MTAMRVHMSVAEVPHSTSGIKTRVRLSERWRGLCDAYLPIVSADSMWRVSRDTRPEEPTQGWKLHISATVLQACDLFERVAPALAGRDLRFKGPDTLDRLIEVNAGLAFGYPQVGKFLTVY